MNRNGPSAPVSGDYLAVLAVDVRESADAFSARVQALVDEFNGSDRCRYPIGLTIGAFGCSPKELKPLDEMLAGADASMYANKQRRQQTLHCDGCAVGVRPKHAGLVEAFKWLHLAVLCLMPSSYSYPVWLF